MQELEPAAPPALPRVGAVSTLHRVFMARDHTQGSLFVSIAALALPALLMGLGGGALFQLAELWFVGQLGSASVAAFGVAGQTLGQLPFLIGFGIAVAAQMLIALEIGARRREEADHLAGQAFLLGFLVSLAIAAVGMFPVELLGLLTRDADVIAVGAAFVRVSYGLMFAQILGMIFSFALSGAGETTTPLLLSLLSTPLTIALQFSLALGHFGLPALGLPGIAIGVAIASCVSLALALAVLLRGHARLRLRARDLRPDPRVLRRLAANCWQPAVHMLVPTLIMVSFMRLAGRIGTDVQAAYAIGLRIESLPVFLSFPIANACATLVGQNLAAGRPARAWSALRAAYGLELAAMAVVSALLLVARGRIVAFFSSDPEVIALASEYLLFAAANVFLVGTYFVSFRALQGAGDVRSPMLASLGAAGIVAVPLYLWLHAQPELTPRAMWTANLVFSATNTALATGWVAFGRWARRPAPAPG